MATKDIFLSGKAKWVHTHKPDAKYGKYSCVLYPDAASLEKIKELKSATPSILNELKRDDEGDYMKFSCDPNKVIGGKMVIFQVNVLKPDGAPLTETLVGNGSDVTIKLEWYTYRKGEGAAVRLKAIRVDNLIPFIAKRDFMDEDKKNVSGLPEQPAPIF